MMDFFAGVYPPVPLYAFNVFVEFFCKIYILCKDYGIMLSWLRIKKITNYINGDEHVTIMQVSLVSSGIFSVINVNQKASYKTLQCTL